MTEQSEQAFDQASDPGPEQGREPDFDHAEQDHDATMPLPPPPPRPDPVTRPPVALIAALAAGVVVAGAVLAVLVGRIGRAPAETAEASPKRFPSPQALVAYLDGRGLACTGYEAVESAPNAIGRGRCVAAGSEVGVGVYAAHSDAEAEWVALARSQATLYMALGENWTVDGPAEWIRQVAEVMDAQYRGQS